MKLIDKDAIVAEIEKRRSKNARNKLNLAASFEDNYLLSFLDTLETKKIDIEKEVIDWWNAHYSSKAYTFEGYTGHYLENSTVIEIAKHFFELGLKAQKGE